MDLTREETLSQRRLSSLDEGDPEGSEDPGCTLGGILRTQKGYSEHSFERKHMKRIIVIKTSPGCYLCANTLRNWLVVVITELGLAPGRREWKTFGL